MNIEMYSWQKEALDKWKLNNYKGILNVVTGAGKTFVAIKAIEILFEKDNNLKTIIIVPTIALLSQWMEMIKQVLTIDENLIGRSGSKFSDKLKDKKIMIYVANSALKFLNNHIKEDTSNPKLLLIADECHRYGSPMFSSIIKNDFDYTLGLSATPERESDYGFEEYLEPNLGNIIFKYEYAQAIKDGIISYFRVINYGITLSGKENNEYRRLSERIKDLRTILERRYPMILAKKDRYIAELRKHENSDSDIRRFLDLAVERKRRLYKSKSRVNCLMQLVNENKNHKIMIFHEDVGSLKNIRDALRKEGYNPIMIHYKEMKDRIEKFEKFKNDPHGILVSARMFSEGVDLPDVDVGIIAAASSSVRQKIQTMGRIIRKSKTKDMAKIINIFIKNTTDERVFSKVDWKTMLGTADMKSLTWPDKKPIEIKHIEKKRFRSKEEEDNRIKEAKLKSGDAYTAQLTGQKYSFDSGWRLFRKINGNREYAKNQEDLVTLAEMVKKIKFRGGSFFINEKGHVLVKNDKFELIFAGILDPNKIIF